MEKFNKLFEQTAWRHHAYAKNSVTMTRALRKIRRPRGRGIPSKWEATWVRHSCGYEILIRPRQVAN